MKLKNGNESRQREEEILSESKPYQQMRLRDEIPSVCTSL